MKTIARIAMALAGMTGLVASAMAENGGLSPISLPFSILDSVHTVRSIETVEPNYLVRNNND